MQPTLVDHLFVLAMIVYFPLEGLRGIRILKREAGVEGARVRCYRGTMLHLWVRAILLLGIWAIYDRSWTELGLGQPHGRFLWMGWLVAGVGLAALLGQQIYIRRADPASLRDWVADLEFMMPHTAGESRWFYGLSVTAGICEQILYRGFLLAYFGTWLGWPLALLFSSLIFGLGHAYQGPAGILKTAMVGGAFGSVVLLTGSVWASMVLHVVLDWSMGVLAVRALGSTPTGGAGQTAAANP